MLSLLSYKVIDTVFNRVFIPTIVILSVAISVFIFNIYASSSVSYYRSLLLPITSLTSLIKCITSSKLMELLYMFIP